MPARVVVAGPVRADSAISRTGLRSVEVKYSVIWLATSIRIDTGQHRVERLPVVEVDAGHRGGAGHGQERRRPHPAVDRGHGASVVVAGADDEDADDGRDDPDGGDHDREDDGTGGERPVADRVERGDAEDDRGDDRDHVGLEEVGRHAGAVADVVAHVVGDGRRVAGVVLGDARLDLADEVGAHVGRLGEDAAADSHEQGEERGAETEADQHRRWRCSGR